jgi:hypothetical protein
MSNILETILHNAVSLRSDLPLFCGPNSCDVMHTSHCISGNCMLHASHFDLATGLRTRSEEKYCQEVVVNYFSCIVRITQYDRPAVVTHTHPDNRISEPGLEHINCAFSCERSSLYKRTICLVSWKWTRIYRLYIFTPKKKLGKTYSKSEHACIFSKYFPKNTSSFITLDRSLTLIKRRYAHCNYWSRSQHN